jgi:hypothetical protein
LTESKTSFVSLEMLTVTRFLNLVFTIKTPKQN